MGAHAVSFDDGHGKEVTIDFPHRVLSPRYYLNLSTLLHQLNIPLKPEDYCLSVSDLGGETFFYWRNLRFLGRLLPTINPLNALKRPYTYFTVIRDAIWFFREVRRDLARGFCNSKTTGEYFEYLRTNRNYSPILLDQMIRPSLASASGENGNHWAALSNFVDSSFTVVATCCYSSVDAIPADIAMRYLTLALTPPGVSVPGPARGVWRPEGGVNQIVAALSQDLKDIRVSTLIESISRNPVSGRTEIKDQRGNGDEFDHVIFATQANQALKILNQHATEQQKSILGVFRHESSTLVLHTDRTAMPQDESSWTSFNMLLDPKRDAPMATLWMNRSTHARPPFFRPGLLPLAKFRVCFRPMFSNAFVLLISGSSIDHPKLENSRNVFQTWNPIIEIDKSKILYEFSFERPVMDVAAATAVANLEQINGDGNIWFIGAYSIYGIPLLESAVLSAYRVVERLGIIPPRIDHSQQRLPRGRIRPIISPPFFQGLKGNTTPPSPGHCDGVRQPSPRSFSSSATLERATPILL